MDGLSNHLVPLGILCGAGVVVLAAAIEDVRHFRIPNAYCLALVLLFPLYVLVSPVPMEWWWNLAFAAALFAFGALAYRTGKFGGGDAKMLAAAGIWAGPSDIVAYLIITALAGGVVAMALVCMTVARTLWFPSAKTDAEPDKMEGKPELTPDFTFKTRIPYGVAIAAGASTVLAGLALSVLTAK
ncbi:MAG: prepilin peptidase [Alphaproteobacteria bacterium]|nr:MAG: prepilin peptidase [Alphaproteobacteria bacterium]